MKTIKSALTMAIIAFAAIIRAQTFTYDFTSSDDNWSGNFADYPVTDSVFYELAFMRTTLPPPLNTSKYALKITGNNHSDDLFMFIKRKLTGLLPNTTYQLFIDVEFASDAPTNATGVGGSPGEGVTLKAGASVVEPLKVVSAGSYLMNIDKGNQSVGGVDMDTIGNVGVSDTTTVFTLINRNNATHLFMVTTDAAGEVWVCIGTDSGYEATTTIYYNRITLTFSVPLHVADLTTSNMISIYPNPATNKLTIDSPEKISRIEIYNLQGEQLSAFVPVSMHTLTEIDLSDIKKGSYFARIYIGTSIQTKKIIIQ